MATKALLKEIFAKRKPIIGMIHLRPLPGSPQYEPAKLDMRGITEIAVEEALTLEEAGVDGLQVENIWDFPYVQGSQIGHETAAALAVAALKVREAVRLPIGINCHLNGGQVALAVAVAAGARWVRVFEWVNAYVSHAGITEGIGGQLARYRHALRADEVKFLCDVNVKHGSHFMISDRSIAEQAHDAESEGADVLIVTGFETGRAPTADRVKELAASVGIPLLIGSGLTAENAADLLCHADGAIVGSYFKVDGDWRKQVSLERARRLMAEVEALRHG